MKSTIRFLLLICFSLLISSDGSSQVPAAENTTASPAQSEQVSPSAEPLDVQLARLPGTKKMMLVVKAKDGTIWSFHADRIKSVAGSTVTLKKRTQLVTGKGVSDTPEDEVVRQIVGKWSKERSMYQSWGGFWFDPGSRKGDKERPISTTAVPSLTQDETEMLAALHRAAAITVIEGGRTVSSLLEMIGPLEKICSGYRVAGVTGYTKDETVLEVASLVKVETKAK